LTVVPETEQDEDVDRQQDCEIGITWLTLECVAEDLFGGAPETEPDEEAQP
jgi:hypothetical protein